MNSETQDIFAWITGRIEPPEAIKSKIFTTIVEFAKNHPMGISDPKEYEKMKKYFTN